MYIPPLEIQCEFVYTRGATHCNGTWARARNPLIGCARSCYARQGGANPGSEPHKPGFLLLKYYNYFLIMIFLLLLFLFTVTIARSTRSVRSRSRACPMTRNHDRRSHNNSPSMFAYLAVFLIRRFHQDNRSSSERLQIQPFPFRKKHNNLNSFKLLSEFPCNILLSGQKTVLIATSLDAECTTQGLTPRPHCILEVRSS